jgi:hypothetical protein
VRATLEAHLGSRQVARVVYGSIIGLTLVVVVEAHPPKTGVVVGWLLLTARCRAGRALQRDHRRRDP